MGDSPLDKHDRQWPPTVAKFAAVVLFGLSALRLIKPEGPVVAVLVAAIAPLLVFGSAAIATYAVRSRHWFMFVSMFALVVLQGFWLLADLGPGAANTDLAAVAQGSIVVATVNVSSENIEIGKLLEGLAESDAGTPDVIALQEVTPEVAAQIEASNSADTYRYRYLDPLPGYHGSAILSRVELIDPRVEWVDGWPMARAEVATANGVVSILNVHVVAPLSSEGSARWKRQIIELGDLALAAEREGVALILAGDFNATIQHTTLARLTDSDAVLADAHLEAGSGLGLTWPDLPLGASLLRLDRVLINQRVTAVSIHTVDAQGSDHRGLVATLTIAPN